MYPVSKPLEARKRDIHERAPISTIRKISNFTGCIIAGVLYFCFVKYSNHPLTLDIIFTIFLAEYCRWSNERRRKHMAWQQQNDVFGLAEKGESKEQKLDCIAAIVGYREEPALFKKALESYLQDQDCCRFILVCIDGDANEDQEMINVFKETYSEKSAVIHFDVPFAEVALQLDRARSKETMDEDIVSRCCFIAKRALIDSNIELLGENAITKLCISQPHMHKKGIMFTSFIVTLAISKPLNIKYLWTSDSDSMVLPGTLARTMDTFAGDPKIGGASTALFIHNRSETIVTRLGNAVYLNELHLARSFTGSVVSNDCQSGPCAAFRIAAIKGELLAWYKQSVLGHWMVVNEDRHLTTRLLLKGWRIVFAADVQVATESPTTLRRWLLQQVRWARAVHVESFFQPSVYIMQSPILFFSAIRRQVPAFIIPSTVVLYLVSGLLLFRGFSIYDYIRRVALTLLYLGLRNPYRPTIKEWLWTIPANLFYSVPLPAIEFWGFLTILHDSWGTSMRASRELSSRSNKLRLRIWEIGFFVLWMGLLAGVAVRYVATTFMLGLTHLPVFIAVGVWSVWILFGWWLILLE